MASLFSRIIARELPAQIIAEDEQYIAFLDIMPLVKGHVLVVPKREVSYIFDLEPGELTGLHLGQNAHLHPDWYGSDWIGSASRAHPFGSLAYCG
jgi:diadenosine tetraphosphate (Ap4A) HIT family hydrolase